LFYIKEGRNEIKLRREQKDREPGETGVVEKIGTEREQGNLTHIGRRHWKTNVQ
jgi:hypothetical protein